MEASEEGSKSSKGKIIITSTPLGKDNWVHQMFMDSQKEGVKGPPLVVWDEAHNLSPEQFSLLINMNHASFKSEIDLSDLLVVGDTYYLSKDNIATRTRFVGKHRVTGEFIFSFDNPLMDGKYILDLGGVRHHLLKENQEFYYLHNGSYVGNAMLWWRKGGSGYTTNIKEAQKYTREEALSRHKSRSTDIPWLASHVDERAISVADNQYMDTVNILRP